MMGILFHSLTWRRRAADAGAALDALRPTCWDYLAAAAELAPALVRP